MSPKRTSVIAMAITILSFILALRGFSHVQAAPDCQTVSGLTTCTVTTISNGETWYSGNVYYILNDVSIASGAALTIEGGAIVKFAVPLDPSLPTANLTGLIVNGTLILDYTGPLAGKSVIFTSGRDDSIGGDTNNDQAQTLPAPGDWDSLQFVKWADIDPAVQKLEIRYSKSGLNFRNITANTYAPVFTSNVFIQNTCGLTLSLTAAGSVGGSVSSNIFTDNKYGFCTNRENGTGIFTPALVGNAFSNNSILPISLNGNSFPTYSGNTFVGYLEPGDKLGIGIAGEFNNSGAFTIVDNMPFVLTAPLEIKGAAINVTIPAGAVFKGFTVNELAKPTDPLPYFRISGGVTLDSSPGLPIIFTSFHDDSVGGDTNGDGINTEGYAGDWAGVHFKDLNGELSPNYTFHDLVFKYAVNGFTYETTVNGMRTPTINQTLFDGNINGLRFKALPNNTLSRIVPFIQNSTFLNHGIIPIVKTVTEPGVPIFLENVVQPTYSGNTFSGNLHPAIGLAGRWRSSASLVQVAGNGLTALPFLVHGEVWFGDANAAGGIDNSVTLTIPGGSVIKFTYNRLDPNIRSRIIAAGQLLLESTPIAPIIFTSYFDTLYGGNTHGTALTPAASDWKDVVIRHPETTTVPKPIDKLPNISNTIFRYGDMALHVENKHATTAFIAGISSSIFEYNNYGLYLDIQNNGDITSEIRDNTFRFNSVGLGTFARDTLNSTPKVMGLTRPKFISNTFESNSLFPMYLNGSASLEFFENSNRFINNDHSAIALGGYFGAVKDEIPPFAIILPKIFAGPELPAAEQLVPYVVWANTNFDWNTPAWLKDGGLVFKFNTGVALNFYGKLTMDTTAVNRNAFTSYRDDSIGGDTNGTPSPNPVPARGDWKGLYLYNPLSSPFLYSTIRYSDQGLVIYQHKNNPNPANIAFRIAENTFADNKNGLTFVIASDNNILSLVENNSFHDNDYGFHTYTEPASPHGGTSNPTLKSNDFTLHTEFPIYLQGSSDPTYIGNAFWSNVHPAIAVGGIWVQDATWTILPDVNLGDMPYVVKENVTQEWYSIAAPTIHLPANLVIKFMNGKYLYAFGYLDLQSVPGSEIIFTSYLDDAFKGDTNHDGVPVSIPRNAWGSVWLMDIPGKNNHIHDARFFYATSGIGLYYDGPENTQTATLLETSEFRSSHSAIAMVIGWRQVGAVIYGGLGNINATIRNIDIADSNYGLLTIAYDKSTGINKPILENITYTNITNYPIFMGGTTEPSFVGLNQILGTPSSPGEAQNNVSGQLVSGDEPSTDLSLAGFDLPGNVAAMDSIKPGSVTLSTMAMPQGSLTATPNLFPAIGMAGAWNNAVTLAHIEGIPYAIVGGFPLTVAVSNYPPFKPVDNVTIGAANPTGAAVAVPPGTVFKLAKDRMIVVKGTLNLTSTSVSPAVFTSIKDDSIYGDTNRDGIATRPAKGDWGEIQLATTNKFQNAVVRYATKGLHIFFDGAINFNNGSIVDLSTFINNVNGISLTTKNDGDIYAQITNSTFIQNTVHILGYPSDVGKTGNLCVDAHLNDLLGAKLTQNGIENNNTNGRTTSLVDCPTPVPFDATNNWWGDASGPYHSVLNPLGLGSRVSDRVKFDPWGTEPFKKPATYTISGRVTKDSAAGNGLSGVVVTLTGPVPPGTNAITDSQGYYQFAGLENGYYIVSPGQAGYSFNPAFLNIILANADAPDSNFYATVNLGLVGFSVDSVSSFRPLTLTDKKYCKFTVSIDQAPQPNTSAKVYVATLDQTAFAGVDYVQMTSKLLTFLPGQPSVQAVNIEIKSTPLMDPPKYFSLILSNPDKGYLKVSSGTCTILTTNTTFLPYIKK